MEFYNKFIRIVYVILRYLMIKLSNLFDILNIMPFVITAIYAVILLLSFYFIIPETIRETYVSPVIAVLVTAVFVPYSLASKVERAKRNREIFNECKDVFYDFLNYVAPTLISSKDTKEMLDLYESFIIKHNAKIDVLLPIKCSKALWELYTEVKCQNGSNFILRKLTEKAINEFRKLMPKKKIIGIRKEAMDLIYNNSKTNAMESEYEQKSK